MGNVEKQSENKPTKKDASKHMVSGMRAYDCLIIATYNKDRGWEKSGVGGEAKVEGGSPWKMILWK